MGLEEVKEEILNNSRAASNKLMEEAKKEAQEIVSKAKKRIDEHKRKLEEDKENFIENLEKMKIAQARSEAKKLILDKKKEMVNRAFEQVKQKLTMLNDKERKDHIQKLIEKAKKEMEIATIYCNKKDKKFLQDFKYQETDIIGGVIVENKDQSIRIDYSFDTILNNIRETSLQEIAKRLF